MPDFSGHGPDAGQRGVAARSLSGYQHRRFGVVATYGAALWSVAFGLLHVYWLLGGQAGLPAGMSVADNAPLLIIDVIAIPLCGVATLLALALVRPWGQRMPRRLLLVAAAGTSTLLLIHTAPTVVDWMLLATGQSAPGDLDHMTRFVTFLYEPIFFTGGALFGLASLGCLYRPRAR